MEHFAAAVEVWEREREHVHTREQPAERLDPGRVRAVRVTHEECPLVEPDGIAAFRELVALEPAEHRQRQVARQRVRLAAAAGLPGLEQDRSLRCHQHRVIDVDRVEVPGLAARLD
jgi:hypothetical protein